jgi:diguanylate cyclase (GGDEF)-like protein
MAESMSMSTRFRFWIGLIAVLLIGAGSAVAAVVVHTDDQADFEALQRDEAVRSARQAEALADVSVGQLASAAAFFQAAEGDFSRHEFDIIARPLLEEGVLSGTAFLQRVPASRRGAYERRHGVPIVEPSDDGPRLSRPRADYFPITYAVSELGTAAPTGYDLGADPERGPFLNRARDLGEPVATPPVKLILGGTGINVYRPVYRDGAPTETVAQRRAALIGFVAGAFHLDNFAAAAAATVPDASEVQLRIDGKRVFGDKGELEDAASARLHVADRVWILVVRDPNRPDVSLPLLLAGVGISLAFLLGALILVARRKERMQSLERDAYEDSLTGLKNRRSFEEGLRGTMARGRRERTTGALLMIDLDDFKRVNDSYGHPAGDSLIGEVAEVLRRRTRESDVLARLGGDEFAIVLPRCSESEARVVAEAIAEAIREHESPEGVGSITASVGVAMFGEDPRTSVETLVREADTAMYAAKDAGRDGVRVFAPEAIRLEDPGT